MNEFDELIITDEADNIIFNEWIEWSHFGIPNKPQWLRDLLRFIYAIFGHCMNCTGIDGCYFVTRKMPKHPLHDNCHCKKIGISFNKVNRNSIAECSIEKFTKYAFVNESKKKLFERFGFSIKDAPYLQREYCRQAVEQYLNGDYRLRNLNMYGQTLAIAVKFGIYTFSSGWLLCPEGKIQLTTPFGGWLNG